MKKLLILICISLIISPIWGLGGYVFAQQAGTLDVAFGTNGFVQTAISNSSFQPSSIVIQPDGKIIASGSHYVSSPGIPPAPGNTATYFVFARYNQNGTLDNTFGTNGIAIINTYNTIIGHGVLQSIALQTDGKIVAVGSNGFNQGQVVRVNTNGTLDNTFDRDGIKDISSISGITFSLFYHVAIQSNGKILISTNTQTGTTNSDMAVIRINTDGSLDLSFDADGLKTIDFGSNDSQTGMDLQADGKIVVTGYSGINLELARLNTDGSLDATFGVAGKQTTALGISYPSSSTVKVQANGKVVVGTFIGNSPSFCLVRYQSNGTLDLSFNGTGIVQTDFDNNATTQENIYDIETLSDGKIIAVGSYLTGFSSNSAIVQYFPDGSIDNSFNGNGKLSLPSVGTVTNIKRQADGKMVLSFFQTGSIQLARIHDITNFNSNSNKIYTTFGSSNEAANAVAIRPNGKIVSAGYSFNAVSGTSNNDFAIVQHNADGSLDNTFGNNALVKTNIATSSIDQIKAISILSDGKILAVGESTSGTNKNIVVAKYLADGSGLDPTFGVSGMRIVSFASSLNATVNTIAVHFSGLILVGGSIGNGANTDFMLARFSSTGSYIGYVTTNFATGNNVGFSLAIQPDSKVILAGQANGDFAVARYNIGTLALDNTFGTGGKVTTTFGATTFEEVRGVAVQTDGKILVSGNTDVNGGQDDFAIIRYNSDGSLDATFGVGGKATVDIQTNSGDLYASLSLYSSGKIVLVGVSNFSTIGIARFNTNGTLDNTFDTDGKATFDFSYNTDQPNTIALQQDGKLIIVGSYYNGTNNDFMLVRYNDITDFTVNNGKMLTSFGNYDNEALDIALQSDGKVIAAGYAENQLDAINGYNGGTFALTRYNTDGTLDNTFGNSGKITTAFDVFEDYAKKIAIQPDGKVIAAGTSITTTNLRFAVVRYNTNGTLDNTFGTGGKVMTTVSTTADQVSDVQLQTDGKIIIGGSSVFTVNRFSLFRYNSNGTPDNTFGTNGSVVTPINTLSSIAGITLQSDGRIIAAGYTKTGTNYDFAIARYTIAGVLDNTFNTTGIFTYDFGSNSDFLNAVAIQADGKIVAGGYISNGANNDFVVIRLNTDGSFDNTFNGNGRLSFPIGSSNDVLRKINILPNGKILLAGYASNGTDFDAALVRLNTDGSFDTSFDNDGKFTMPIGSANDYVNSVAVNTSNGNVYIAGGYDANTNRDFFLQKLPICAIETPVLVNSADNYPNNSLPNPQIGRSLTATNFILNTANVSYRSTQFQSLLPGFKADLGSVFRTEIVGCSY